MLNTRSFENPVFYESKWPSGALLKPFLFAEVPQTSFFYDLQRPAAQPATVPVQSDEDKHRYVRLSICLFVCRMYVSMYVCTLFCRCMQVCACHLSLQSITLLLAHSPLFLLLLLLSLLLLFLAAVVAVAADDHIAAISAALVAAVAAAATAFAAAVTAAVWCCCCLVLLLLLLLLLLLVFVIAVAVAVSVAVQDSSGCFLALRAFAAAVTAGLLGMCCMW